MDKLIEEAEKLLELGNKANFFTSLKTIRALVDRLKAADEVVGALERIADGYVAGQPPTKQRESMQNIAKAALAKYNGEINE